MATGTLNNNFGSRLQSTTVNVTTNSSGSAVLSSDGKTFIVAVHLDSLGSQNYTFRLGESGNITYLHLMDEQGNAQASKNIYVTYLYIDF